MELENKLKGWNLIIYELILKNFNNTSFSLKEIYKYEIQFKKVYPNNLHIKDKIRQTLQNLRNLELVEFLGKGNYKLIDNKTNESFINEDIRPEYVYLLSNPAMPEWVKIGRTYNLDERVKNLYNTSIPLPFKLEDKVEVMGFNNSVILERSIHNIIDTINPSLR